MRLSWSVEQGHYLFYLHYANHELSISKQTLTRFLASFEMTGFAVMRLLAKFSWARIGIIAEKKLDIIWMLTRQGLEYAAELSNVTVAASTLWQEDMDLEKVLLDTAAVSRSR